MSRCSTTTARSASLSCFIYCISNLFNRTPACAMQILHHAHCAQRIKGARSSPMGYSSAGKSWRRCRCGCGTWTAALRGRTWTSAWSRCCSRTCCSTSPSPASPTGALPASFESPSVEDIHGGVTSLEACPLAVTSSCAARTVSQTASRATPGWSVRWHLVRLYSTRVCQVLLAMADAALQGSGALRGCSRERFIIGLDTVRLEPLDTVPLPQADAGADRAAGAAHQRAGGRLRRGRPRSRGIKTPFQHSTFQH